MNHNPRLLCLSSPSEAVEELKKIGVETYGIEAMAPKMVPLNILLEGIECRVANILKQEMLSIGGDLAVARGSVDCSIEKTDALIMGTSKQVEKFLVKISRQPFGISQLAQDISEVISLFYKDKFVLRTPRRDIRLGERTLVMGILNTTPDSFSDGGVHLRPEMAVARAMQMAEDGADIIDIGGESTRPGSEGVPLETEISRTIPVIERLAVEMKIPISIDTTKAEVARIAFMNGAEIINDVSALTSDERMADVVSDTRMSVVVMHMRGTPQTMQTGDLHYASLRGEIIAFLRERVRFAGSRGIEPDRIIVDPGMGFGKTSEDNLRILRYLREFRVLGFPVLVGPSRKGFIGKFSGVTSPGGRDTGTAAAITAAIINGADIVRVHDVKGAKEAAGFADALCRAASL